MEEKKKMFGSNDPQFQGEIIGQKDKVLKYAPILCDCRFDEFPLQQWLFCAVVPDAPFFAGLIKIWWAIVPKLLLRLSKYLRFCGLPSLSTSTASFIKSME